MNRAPAAPTRRLVPLTLAVLVLHVMVLRMRPDDALQPGKEAVKTFSTRLIAAPPAPPAPAVVAAAPAPAVAAPAARPRTARIPAPAVAPAPEPQAAAPAPAEENTPVPTDLDSGGPALKPPPAAAPPVPSGEITPGLPQVVALPVPAKLRYEVTAHRFGLPLQGEAELNWRHDGQAYEATLEIRSALGNRSQRSSGRITEDGLAPDTYWEKTRNEQATHFQRGRGEVTFSNNRPAQPLAPGMQDRLSVVVQLAVLVGGQPGRFPPGTQIAIPTAGTRDAETWIFSVKGEEELQLPGGKVRALKIERRARKEYDVTVELWLAPHMDYAPVRVRLTNPNGDTVDQRWSSTDKG